MKQITLILITIFMCLKITACSQRNQGTSTNVYEVDKEFKSDSSIIELIRSINKRDFIGRPVDSLMKDKVLGKYKTYTFVDLKPGLLDNLILRYSDDVFIELRVKGYKYMNPFDEKREWKLSSYKKESLGKINVFYKDKCLEVIE